MLDFRNKVNFESPTNTWDILAYGSFCHFILGLYVLCVLVGLRPMPPSSMASLWVLVPLLCCHYSCNESYLLKFSNINEIIIVCKVHGP